nr:Mariner Mos1 transposase [Hymenolepis microstoma]
MKPSKAITDERYRTQLMRSLSCAQEKKNGHGTTRDMIRLFYSMIMLDILTMPKWWGKISQIVEMGNFATSPATLSRCCSIWFSPHSSRPMAHGLAHQQFSSYEEVKNNCIDSWILSKDDKVFRRGIRLVLERWAKVVADDGQYFET